MNLTASRRLAAAITNYNEWTLEVFLHPKQGLELAEQIKQRARAERAMRDAFKEATGCTIVYRRGAYTARN